VIINVIKINWNQSLIVLPKYVGLIDCIDKSKNTKYDFVIGQSNLKSKPD
jgi:hypothetical protein